VSDLAKLFAFISNQHFVYDEALCSDITSRYNVSVGVHYCTARVQIRYPTGKVRTNKSQWSSRIELNCASQLSSCCLWEIRSWNALAAVSASLSLDHLRMSLFRKLSDLEISLPGFVGLLSVCLCLSRLSLFFGLMKSASCLRPLSVALYSDRIIILHEWICKWIEPNWFYKNSRFYDQVFAPTTMSEWRSSSGFRRIPVSLKAWLGLRLNTCVI